MKKEYCATRFRLSIRTFTIWVGLILVLDGSVKLEAKSFARGEVGIERRLLRTDGHFSTLQRILGGSEESSPKYASPGTFLGTVVVSISQFRVAHGDFFSGRTNPHRLLY